MGIAEASVVALPYIIWGYVALAMAIGVLSAFSDVTQGTNTRYRESHAARWLHMLTMLMAFIAVVNMIFEMHRASGAGLG